MTELGDLAARLRVSDRTLRRAARRGTIRCIPRGARLQLPMQEELYLERHWQLLQALVSELRTLPNVRLAVVFGSIARGDGHEQSDIDLLVELRMPGLSARSQVIGRLEGVSGRRVQLVELPEASSLLLLDVLRDGRILVDRDEGWPALRRQLPVLTEMAAAERRSLDDALAVGLRDLFGETEGR